MGLEIQRKKDGTLRSKWWYGRFVVNGKSSVVNLAIEVGNDPVQPDGGIVFIHAHPGNQTFESRVKAMV